MALAGGLGHGGGRDQGEKGEGKEGVRFPYSPRAEVVCGVRATVTGGGGRLWPWRRCCRLGEGASGGGDGCGGRELRGGPLYRPGEAVERGGRRWPSSAAINGGSALSGCREAAARFAAAYRTTRRLRQRRAARRGGQRGVRAQRRPTRHACTRWLVAAWCGPTRGALAVQRLGVSAASACARSNGSRGASGGAVAVRARVRTRGQGGR